MEIMNRERSEIENKYKWDLSIMYKSIEEWESDFDITAKEIESFSKFAGTLGDSAEQLLKVLQKKDEISRIYDKLASYAVRKNDEDTRDSDGVKLKNKVISLGTEFGEAASFFGPELMSISDDKINNFLEKNKDIAIYKQYLANILRFRDHTLSLAEEKILASATEVLASPSKTFTILNNADIKFGVIKDEDGNEVELSKGSYTKYISSQNREVRKETFEKFYEGYKGLKNTFAETLIGDIKANFFMSKNKKFKNPLEMSLFNNNIDPKVYDNVIKTVNENLDKMHRYVSLRKKVLGLDELHMYDMYVDLIREYSLEYSYEEALELIFEALKPLGEKYIEKAKRVFDERWVDVFENSGKMSGAYSSLGYDTPPYILLNYNGKLDSVGTLIHELGHSMHTYHSAEKQPYIYHEYSIFVAEVASNVNEMLLNMYMLDHVKNKQERLSLINDFLESVKGSIYRQTMFAEFEKTIYDMENDKKTLTEEELSNLYYDLNKKYYGNELIHDEAIRYEWMRIPHFYYQFYVYQYATGLTAAFFIARDIYEGNVGAREKYIEFLSSGSSDYPLNLLKCIGIDMTGEEPIKRILKYFEEQLNEFERIIEEK